MTEPLVGVVELGKRFGETMALEGVSFRVEEGEIFGLLGPNGAGKTTLLSILACLLAPNSGEARLFGRAASPRDREVRRRLGIVPQELALYGDLTARENLLFFGGLYGLADDVLCRKTDAVLEAMGLADRADDRVDTFSGGMQRRLNLGAALVHDPQLVLLDEPTIGVDPQSRNHIFEEIKRLNARGVTIIYTSHYMEEVEALCRRIGIIDHGRLIACDTLPLLLQRLQGQIRFQVSEVALALRERLAALTDAHFIEEADHRMALECRDVTGTLLRLIALLKELQIELTHIETIEPNLERVFLHLTGKTLRD
ncbi:MAG TPA: ATP-binding cassette domain-containing protein [Pirellulales bacterium]|jgi:ABC-2 type transport system ATP-binding protein|nr:ATP-binding cassette domain-containing protein [Pirellulales bacterium]